MFSRIPAESQICKGPVNRLPHQLFNSPGDLELPRTGRATDFKTVKADLALPDTDILVASGKCRPDTPTEGNVTFSSCIIMQYAAAGERAPASALCVAYTHSFRIKG
jgi:hypothetical protein